MNYLLHVHTIHCNSILPYYFGGDCEMSPFSTMLDPKFLPVHRIDPASHRSLHLSPVAQRRHDSRKAMAYSLGTFENRETWGCKRFLCFGFLLLLLNSSPKISKLRCDMWGKSWGLLGFSSFCWHFGDYKRYKIFEANMFTDIFPNQNCVFTALCSQCLL